MLTSLRSLRAGARVLYPSYTHVIRMASTTTSDTLKTLGLSSTQANPGVFNGCWSGKGEEIVSINPATEEKIGSVIGASETDYEECIEKMKSAKTEWMMTPSPMRAEIVRKISQRLRAQKQALGSLVSIEMGKILPEGLGEVQEAIDVCDFAVGLSRSLNGQVIPSERKEHLMLERYNPLRGNVGIISAFNFPVAVFFWNAALSLICGNTQLWKPAESVSLTGIACTKIIEAVFAEENMNGAIASMICGVGKNIGQRLVGDKRNELISFTGSTRVGKQVNTIVAERFGRALLELGGNNAMIVMDDADIDLALQAALFAAVGTAGQRCTSLRRLILHEDIHDEFIDRLVATYRTVRIGDPLEPGVLCGPLHSESSAEAFLAGIETAKSNDGEVLVGGNSIDGIGHFVEPAIVSIDHTAECVQRECFAPILYTFKVKNIEEAIEMNNSVPQGLSSALFSRNVRNTFKWTGEKGSDCGLVNVNIGTSGAEIGGAFGGDKETGGGRECGSDSWKQYCRRSTCTINYSDELPLAQGIVFDTPLK